MTKSDKRQPNLISQVFKTAISYETLKRLIICHLGFFSGLIVSERMKNILLQKERSKRVRDVQM